MYILDFLQDASKVMDQFKQVIYDNKTNPIMWLGFFILGLLIFEIVYYSLQKEK